MAKLLLGHFCPIPFLSDLYSLYHYYLLFLVTVCESQLSRSYGQFVHFDKRIDRLINVGLLVRRTTGSWRPTSPATPATMTPWTPASRTSTVILRCRFLTKEVLSYCLFKSPESVSYYFSSYPGYYETKETGIKEELYFAVSVCLYV